jgi:predicted amidophosphoribosyltransferase
VEYRPIRQPADWRSRSSQDWVGWVAKERLAPSIRPDEERVCRLCHGAVGLASDGQPWAYCAPCLGYRGFLDGLVPIAYSAPSGLESALHRYKDSAGFGWLAAPLASMLYHFLERHAGCIQDRFGPIDVMTVVPSHPGTRGGWDAMKVMVAVIQGRWPWPWDLDLLVRTDPATPPRGRVARLFNVAADCNVRGRRILVVDDTFTSGRTIASAAATLKLERAQTAVGLTLGRQVGVNWPPAAHLVDSLADRDLDLGRCVLERERARR